MRKNLPTSRNRQRRGNKLLKCTLDFKITSKEEYFAVRYKLKEFAEVFSFFKGFAKYLSVEPEKEENLGHKTNNVLVLLGPYLYYSESDTSLKTNPHGHPGIFLNFYFGDLFLHLEFLDEFQSIRYNSLLSEIFKNSTWNIEMKVLADDWEKTGYITIQIKEKHRLII